MVTNAHGPYPNVISDTFVNFAYETDQGSREMAGMHLLL